MALQSLVRLERPLDEAISHVYSFPWDWDGEPLCAVTQTDLANVLARWSRGQMTAEDLENWANALEVRDDVEFSDEQIKEAIHELANPLLHPANSLDGLAARFVG